MTESKRTEIRTAAEDLLATSIRITDANVIAYALKRVHDPLADEKDGAPGYTQADRDIMYEVLAYRVNRYRPPSNHLTIQE
jgi:hypothetical protein